MQILITTAFLVLCNGSVLAVTNCSSKDGMTPEVRQMFVDKHNDYRSLVAKGQAANPKFGGNAPKAARMLKVSYDCKVEENMMDWAKKCKFEHSPPNVREGWGQNLFETSQLKLNKTKAAAQGVDSWFGELKSYGVPPANNLTMAVFNKGVGHYTQVVWQSSNKIGCAVVWCANMTLVGCEYNPAGNLLNSLIYDIGNPCTTDKNCGCSGCKCSKNEALCIPP